MKTFFNTLIVQISSSALWPLYAAAVPSRPCAMSSLCHSNGSSIPKSSFALYNPTFLLVFHLGKRNESEIK